MGGLEESPGEESATEESAGVWEGLPAGCEYDLVVTAAAAAAVTVGVRVGVGTRQKSRLSFFRG